MRRSWSKWSPFLLYAILAGWLGWQMRDALNPDGMVYLRNAQELAAGEFMRSVSSYWGPLISWCTAPLLWTGLDSVHAIRLVLLAWGAL